MKKTSSKPYMIYLFITGADWFLLSLFSTVIYVFLATYVTNDPFQLVFFWTVLTAATLIFEIPTGLVADVYSRRLSVIIGFGLMGIAALIQGLFPVYGIMLIGQVITGIGYTFISGAKDAWIADEVGDSIVNQAYMQGSQVGQIAYLIGIPISTALGTIALNIPIILSGSLLLLVALLLVLIMPEEGFQPSSSKERDSWPVIFNTFKDSIRMVRGRTILLAILIISAVYGLSGSGFDDLWTVFMLENIQFPNFGDYEPIVWFGILNTVVTILGLIGTEYIRRVVDLERQSIVVRTLLYLTILTAVSMIIFGVTKNFWLAGSVYCLSITFRTMSDPIFRIWINQNIESNVRATIMSMDSQANSLGLMIGGPIIGLIGTMISLPAALITAGLARVPVAILYARLALKGKKEPGRD